MFRRISKQLPQLTSLELQYVSPKLLKCRDLELAVPGSYTPGQDLIRISSIQTNLQVSAIVIAASIGVAHKFVIHSRSSHQNNVQGNYAYADQMARITCSC